jgi:hypothetical protein
MQTGSETPDEQELIPTVLALPVNWPDQFFRSRLIPGWPNPEVRNASVRLVKVRVRFLQPRPLSVEALSLI